jgi:hypothetical protein
MRYLVWLAAALVPTMAFACAADAQSERSNRRTGSSAKPSSAAAPPTDSANPANSINPVKRTWDFTKRFSILRYDGRAGCDNDAAKFEQLVADYNGRVNSFLSGPTDAKKLTLERKNYVRQVLGADRDIASYLSVYSETGQSSPDGSVPSLAQDICRAKLQRYSLLAIREGLKAMGRVYPDMAEVAPALAKANAAIARVGDEKAIQKFVSANRTASLAQVRMKPPLTRNAEWEKGLLDGFKRLVPGENVLKLHLYSANWYVHKNELTSYPEYRQIGAWVATKRSDGSCWINGIDLWQNYVGNGFERGEYKLGQAPKQILCENV